MINRISDEISNHALKKCGQRILNKYGIAYGLRDLNNKNDRCFVMSGTLKKVCAAGRFDNCHLPTTF